MRGWASDLGRTALRECVANDTSGAFSLRFPVSSRQVSSPKVLLGRSRLEDEDRAKRRTSGGYGERPCGFVSGRKRQPTDPFRRLASRSTRATRIRPLTHRRRSCAIPPRTSRSGAIFYGRLESAVMTPGYLTVYFLASRQAENPLLNVASCCWNA